jgi:hypothetical protein
MPSIFIGIGGIGGSIVSQVRQALDVRVAFAGDSPAARDRANDFRFVVVDTWKDNATRNLRASQMFDVPAGASKHNVNARVEAWYHGSDPAFKNWWPERNRMPLKVGDYDSGAGQLRLKGKLAYRISLSGGDRLIVDAVKEALHGIERVHGPESDVRIVNVYLVCSLGGGTGSGLVLALAQHLKETLPPHCRVIGAFPLASVTELGPGTADTSSIWANTDAALREIDYSQRHLHALDDPMNPFLQWNQNTISGAEPPFQYVYLFGRRNSNGQTLPEFSQYVDLIAQTLIAETFSDLVDEEGLPEGIAGPHSQFISNLEATPTVGGRPTTYASAAVASLVYPAERIERHLARRYAAAVLDRLVQVDRAQVLSRTDEFMKREALRWGGTPPFQRRLTDVVVSSSGQRMPLPQLQILKSLEDDKTFEKADPAQARAYTERLRNELDTFVSERYTTHLRQRRLTATSEYSASSGGIRQYARQLLAESGPSALGLTHAVVAEIRRELSQQWEKLNEEIEGNPNATVPVEGKKKAVVRLQDRWSSDVTRLGNGFGSGISKVFRKNGKEAKEQFFKRSWVPLREATLDLELGLAGRETYRALVAETTRVENALKELLDHAGNLKHDLELATSNDVGDHGASGVLDLSVLDNPQMIAYHFDSLLDEAKRQGVDTCAVSVTTKTTSDDTDSLEEDSSENRTSDRLGLVSEFFDRKTSPQSGIGLLDNQQFDDELEAAIVEDGVRRLGHRIRELSIWQALVAEFEARAFLGLQDRAMSMAFESANNERNAAERAGAPPKDWSKVALRHFIRNKLFECQKRAEPYWQINDLMQAQYGTKPYGFVVVTADRDAYGQAQSALGITGVLEDTARLMGAGTPNWMSGRDRVVMYAREGVVPLFYLDESEIAKLRESTSRKKSEGKFLYTDRRFEACTDDMIRPEESREDKYLYAIALGMQLGVVERTSHNGHLNGAISVPALDHAQFSSVVHLFDTVLDDPDQGEQLLKLVDRAMSRISAAERPHEVQRARARALKMLQDAEKLDQPGPERYWKSADRVIATRIAYGRYLIEA